MSNSYHLLHHAKSSGILRTVGILLFGLISINSWAMLTAEVTQPAENQEVTAGDYIGVQVHMQGAAYGISTVSIDMEGYAVQDYSYEVSPPTDEDWIDDVYLIPSRPAGQTLTITVTVNGYADEPVTIYRHVKLKAAAPDTQAPVFGGVSDRSRRLSDTEAYIEWDPATDNVTSSMSMVYLIYSSTSASAVFSSGVKFTSLPGGDAIWMQQLDPLTTYYYAVRARDAAGNVDTNTKIVTIGPMPNAVPQEAWALYE